MFIVDIPTIECVTSDNEESCWSNAGKFATKSEAIEFIRENFGPCDEDGNVSLLTEIDDE